MKTLLKTNHGLFKLIPILGILIVFAKQFDAQSDFSLDVTLGGGAGFSRTDFVSNSYSSEVYRAHKEVSNGFNFFAHPEVSVYVESRNEFGLKFGFSRAEVLNYNYEKVVLRPNLGIYFKKVKNQRSRFIGLSFDNLKSRSTYRNESILNHIGKGIFIGTGKNRLRTELHLNYYRRKGSPSCYCDFTSAYPRFGIMLRINYAIITIK